MFAHDVIIFNGRNLTKNKVPLILTHFYKLLFDRVRIKNFRLQSLFRFVFYFFKLFFAALRGKFNLLKLILCKKKLFKGAKTLCAKIIPAKSFKVN